MRIISPRIAQARCLCNCPSCRSTTNAIVRRAATATARRTVRVSDVFTLSLSSLAAGLAFTEARKKDDRRKQWDKVIGEARARLEETEIQQQNRLAALSDAGVEALGDPSAVGQDTALQRPTKNKDTQDALKIEGMVPWAPTLSEEVGALDTAHWVPFRKDEIDTWLDVFEWTQEQHRIREASGFQDWKGPPLSLLQSLSESDLYALLSNKLLLRHFYGGPDCNNLVNEPPPYPFWIKKTRILEWSVAKLTLKLIMYSRRYFSHHLEDEDCPTISFFRQLLTEGTVQSNLERMEEQLRILKTDRRDLSYYYAFERPPSPNYDDIMVEDLEEKSEIDTYLENLPELMKQPMDFGDIISKICHLLLTARNPPRIHTYNLLLTHFSALDKHDQFHAVYISMRESMIRPNETSFNTILRYCTVKCDRTLFVCYLTHMQKCHRGLALAHPDFVIPPMLKDRYHIFGEHHHKAALKARMNGQVYEAVIVGAIQFLGGQWAMHFYRNMISEGWSPSFGILLAILQDCCRRLDWTVGIAVLEQINRTADKANTLAYEWMLRLCQRCAQREFFNQVLINGVRCDALPASILDLPDHAQTGDIGLLIERAIALQPRKVIGSLEMTAERTSHRLDDKSSFVLENVVQNFSNQLELRHTIPWTEMGWRARRILENRLNDLSAAIVDTVSQAYQALSSSETPPSVKFWLSRQVMLLEQGRVQEANTVTDTWYSDIAKHQEVQRNSATRSEDGDSESDDPKDLPLTKDSSEDEATEYVSYPQPGTKGQQNRPVEWHPSNLLNLLPPLEEHLAKNLWHARTDLQLVGRTNGADA